MTVTRGQLLADPKSGVRPLSRDEQAERARDAELATQWLPATSPQGHRCQAQVSHAEVLEDMRRAGWRVHEASRHAEAEREAV